MSEIAKGRKDGFDTVRQDMADIRDERTAKPVELFDLINRLPGCDGFWTQECHDAFHAAAKRLQLVGIGDKEIFQILESLMDGARHEFAGLRNTDGP